MPDSSLPQIPPQELAERLDRGESLQVLDVRAPEKVERGHVTIGSELAFHAHPSSQILALPDISALHLDPARPIAVICGHGNSSRRRPPSSGSAGLKRIQSSGHGRMGERIRRAPTLSHAVTLACGPARPRRQGRAQLPAGERRGRRRGRSGRHVERYDALLAELRATPRRSSIPIFTRTTSAARALPQRAGRSPTSSIPTTPFRPTTSGPAS